MITNIQRFSLDDGDGIRTTVFFKGCPLHCLWCHNPECIGANPDLQYNSTKCTICGACTQACPHGAISAMGPQAGIDRAEYDGGRHQIGQEACEGRSYHLEIDRIVCDGCGLCVQNCKYGALEKIGLLYTVEGLQQELLKDLLFYRNSGGGVTLSGGEPLLHDKFLAQLLPALKKDSIHIAIDTCGFFPQTERLPGILEQTNLILFDIKAMDSALHKQLTGCDNEKILFNFDMLCRQKTPVRVRIPLVAGVNDATGEIKGIADFLAAKNAVGLELVELLPYHAYGASKYKMLGLEYYGEDYASPSAERLQALSQLFEAKGIPVRIAKR